LLTTITQQDVAKVPGREHYSLKYLRGARIFSYAHQIQGILSFEPGSVVEIGVGGGMVTAALRSTRIDVTTVDVRPDLKPDVVASVIDLPFSDGQFDVALCCQVLEHLPFEQFGAALRELRRVSRKGAVISLPDVTAYGFVAAKVPMMQPFAFHWNWPQWRPREMSKTRSERSGHCWEIGFRHYPLARIRKAIVEAGWTIDADWRVPERRWHHFFRLVA